MEPLTFLAAGPSLDTHQVIGVVTMTGIAACSTFALILGVRGSDVIKLRNKKTVGGTAIVTGSLIMAAGGTLADIVLEVHSVPDSALNASGVGTLGAGGVALFLTLCTFGPKWKRMIWPALFGLAAAVAWDEAGGIGGILMHIVQTAILNITGAK